MPGLSLYYDDVRVMFPVVAELGELGFHLTLSEYRVDSKHEVVYRVTADGLNPVELRLSVFALVDEPAWMISSQIERLLDHAVREWRLKTALEFVRGLKNQVEDLKRVNVERAEQIKQLTEERDRANRILDLLDVVKNDPDAVVVGER